MTTPDPLPASATDPAAVPATPKERAPLDSELLATVVQPAEPLEVSILPAEPPVVQPVPPVATAQVGLLLLPWVCRNRPDVPGARAVQVGTANFVDPKAVIEIIAGIKGYLAENKFERIEDIEGIL